jgi:hypothetical protein
MTDIRGIPQRPIRMCLIVFALLAALFSITAPFVELAWWKYWIGGLAYSAFLSAFSVGLLYVPPRVALALGISGCALVLLVSAVFLLLLRGDPDDLDSWFAILRPLGLMLKLVLIAAVLLSAVGWIRYFRGTHKRHRLLG